MNTLENIKSTIEERLCPIHDIHPLVESVGAELKITCCCHFFYARCLQDMKNIQYKIELERSLEI